MYFITMHVDLEDCENDKFFVGWFRSRDMAIECVVNNVFDLNETVYDYAQISFIPEGIFMIPEEDIWFAFNYDTKKYEAFKAKISKDDFAILFK